MTTNEEKADDVVVKAVAERLQFFFSDANVRQDKFMRQRLMEDDKQVTIEDLLKFNSIKKHTTDPEIVAQAAKTLLADKLVLSDDATKIARVTPFTTDKMSENIPLTLYVKNLPITGEGEDAKYDVSMQDIRDLFEPFGKVAIVKLRFKWTEGEPGSKRKFAHGGAFVEYETEEEQQKAAKEVCTLVEGEAVEPKQKLTVGGKTLEVRTMKDWRDSKKKKHGKAADTEASTPSKKREREEEDDEKEQAVEVEVKEFTLDWKPGCVIQLEGLSDTCDREAMRAVVAKELGITEKQLLDTGIYVDFSRGQTKGAIRFRDPSDTIGAICTKLSNGELEIAGAKVTSARILEGDEETKYWTDFIEFKNKQKRHFAEEKAARKKSRRGR